MQEAEVDGRSKDPDDTIFYRTVLMIDAQLRYYRGKLQELNRQVEEGLK